MAVERQTETIEASPAERASSAGSCAARRSRGSRASAARGLALGVALAPPPPVELEAPAPSDAHASAAHEKLRAEIANLREELEVLRSAEPAESPRSDDFEARLAKLEAGPAEPAPQMADSAPDSEELGDLTTIRDRLYNLESRLDGKEQ